MEMPSVAANDVSSTFADVIIQDLNPLGFLNGQSHVLQTAVLLQTTLLHTISLNDLNKFLNYEEAPKDILNTVKLPDLKCVTITLGINN